jgi:glycosyltransferase, family 2
LTFISIIIPVYNAEDFLDSCLTSVIGQTHDDWEVILVDDGSSDRSPEICDGYAAQDPRFRVVHQDNAGTSAARNAGIAIAEGDYITFMDNDDWWLDSTCLAKVVASLVERPVDLLWHMSCRSNFDGTQIQDTESTALARRVAELPVGDAIRLIIDSGMTTSAVWTKVVRRRLLAEHGIVFPTGMRNEDTEWSAKVLAHCASVGWFDERFYVYRMGHPYAQTSHRLAPSSVIDLEKILRENLTLAETLPGDRCAALKAFLAYPFIVWVGQASALKLLKEHDVARRELLSQLGPVTGFSRDSTARAVSIACRVLGAQNTARLLGLAFRRKHPQHTAA